MSIVKSLIKFLFPICILIGLVIYFSKPSQKLKTLENHKSYFIGSSRVQRSIDPKLLNEHTKETEVYNLGMSSSTFLHNMILAEHIIERYKADELFIELSPIVPEINHTHVQLDIVDFPKIIKHAELIDFFDLIENYLYVKYNPRHTLKNILFPNNRKELDIGYIFSDANNCHSTESFLKIADIKFNEDCDITNYSNLITELNKVAKKNHTKIRYFLPLTFKRDEERKIVAAVFKYLPVGQKVIYTGDFLDSISNSINLKDNNHFNNRGANIMTLYFKNKYFTD